MKREEKPFFVQDLTERLKSATSFVLIDYSGLNVKNLQELKKRLSSVDSTLLVVKNTLFKIASKKAGISEEVASDTILKGPTALVITEKDPITPIQVLYNFSQEFGITNLKVGIIGKKFQNKNTLEKIAKLPSKEALIVQTVSLISSPINNLLNTLESNLQKLISLLSQKSKLSN